MHEAERRLRAIRRERVAKSVVETRNRVGIAIGKLEEDVLPAAAKRLKRREELRLRVGDYRVLYVVTADIVTVMAVGHRREVYR